MAEVKNKETKKEKKVDVSDLKKELQKLVLEVRTGKESNTSKVSKLKKKIARELTKLNAVK